MADDDSGVHDPAVRRQLDWDDPRLVADPDPRRRQYRLLQSWYRHHRLKAPHAWTKPRAKTAKRPAVPARPVGNVLDADWAAENPTGNFLHTTSFADDILAYVRAREPIVRRLGGSLEPVRLRTNLLSSMPLCFNLFAPLRNHPDAAVDLMRRAFGLNATELTRTAGIDGIECEWAPEKERALGDRTAFDAVIAYRDDVGRRCLLGIETKYTETFSPKEYGKPRDKSEADHRERYRHWTTTGWFRPGAEDRLWKRATNQLWRNVMLGIACEQIEDVDRVDIAVVSLERDRHAEAALRGVRQELHDPARLIDVPLERILHLTSAGDLDEWSRAMRERYTDLRLDQPG